MGSPLASLMVDIFLNSIENGIFNSSNNLVNNVAYWFRHVDDILCLWRGTKTELHNSLTFLKSHHPNIQLTLEIGGSKINFLDLSININGGHHTFDIYRKADLY